MRFYNQIDITCYKMTWASTVDLSDVNVFSNVNPVSTSSIDLKLYLRDMGSINYEFDEAEKENGENQLYFVASDVDFNLHAISGTLKDFFGIYANTDFIKWQVDITLNDTIGSGGTVIWRGLVHHESIDYMESAEKEDLKFTALSFEREFKEWYSSQDLPQNVHNLVGGVNAISKAIDGLVNPGFTGTGYQRLGTSIDKVCNILFTGADFDFEEGLNQWYVINNPVLAQKNHSYGTSDNFVMVKSSYERIRTNGENRYDWFRKTQNAMGWVFYYYNGSFQVKNRSTDITTTTTLDVNKFQDLTVSKYRETNTFPHILILDGVVDGGNATGGNAGGEGAEYQPYQMRGARFQLLSSGNEPRITNGLWWDSISAFSLDPLNNGEKLIRFFNEDNTSFRFAIHTRQNAPILPPTAGWDIERRSIAQADMLRIDAGDTGNEMWLYDVTNGDNNSHTRDASSPAPANQWTNERVRFSGNYGNALVKLTSNVFGTKQIIGTYQDYTEENLYYENLAKFYQSRLTRKIAIEYDEVIYDPLQKFVFSNDTENKYTGEWVINSMSVDIMNDKTSLVLQKKRSERT